MIDILPLGVACIAVLLGFVFFLKWKTLIKEINELKRNNELSNVMVTASLGGYYYWDAQNSTEDLSLNLVRMFNLRKEINNFNDFSALFNASQDDLIKHFEQLRQGKSSHFVINISAEISGKDAYFQCVGNRVEDTDGKNTGVIIWFFDITDYMQRIFDANQETKELKHQLNHYLSILNALPFPIWQYNKDQDVQFYNMAYGRFVDNEVDETHDESIPSLDNSLRDQVPQIITSHQETSLQKHIVFEGKRQLYNIRQLPVKNQKAVLGFAENITKQEELERELQSHITAHEDLLESTSSAMAIYGRDKRLKFYNNAFCKLWDVEEKWLDSNPTYDEFLVKLRDLRKLPEQADFTKFRKEQTRLFQDLIDTHNEFFHLPDGKSVRVIVIPHALGGLLFVYEDMTDHLAMESSYNTLMAVQKETLDNLREGIMVVGQDGKLKLYNPMFLHIWPTVESIVDDNPHISQLMEASRHLFKVSDDDWHDFRQRMISEINGYRSCVRRYERSDGRVLERTTIPLPDGASLVTFVDMTDSTLVERSLRERTEALEKVDQLKTQFLANVSYELRTPLTSIMGFTEALEGEFMGALNEQQKDYINYIYNASRHLMVLINDVLDLASIKAGYLTLDIRSFALKPALEDIVTMLTSPSDELDVTIHLDFDQTLDQFVGDEKRIKQISFNLISNSLKFTKRGDSITLGAQLNNDNEVVIWVEDSGKGIPSEMLTTIFDSVSQSRDTHPDKMTGSGFGLPIVKSIVELHEGRLEIETENRSGTKISCYFEKDGTSLLAKEEREKQAKEMEGTREVSPS